MSRVAPDTYGIEPAARSAALDMVRAGYSLADANRVIAAALHEAIEQCRAILASEQREAA